MFTLPIPYQLLADMVLALHFGVVVFVVGGLVMVLDPIFQGLAISLMAGEVASLLLSRVTVPILYYLSERKRHSVEESL